MVYGVGGTENLQEGGHLYFAKICGVEAYFVAGFDLFSDILVSGYDALQVDDCTDSVLLCILK